MKGIQVLLRAGKSVARRHSDSRKCGALTRRRRVSGAASTLLVLLLSLATALATVTVQTEQIGMRRDDWNAPAWAFKNIHAPSRSAASRAAKIRIIGRAESSCLSPDGLHNGVMPQQTRQRRDFFAFANGADGGLIVMDLGRVIPVAEVNSYSAHGPVGGTTWATEFDGARGPQVYTLYGSAAAQPDPRTLEHLDWAKIAEVDTRPRTPGANWGGRWGVNIRDDQGETLGRYRWLVWRVRRTVQPGDTNAPQTDFTSPEWANTWYAELDVHTPDTVARAGNFVSAGTRLKEIIVAYKQHFDIGFTHPAPEIVNLYRTTMIDSALALMEASRSRPPDERFAWTIPSWVAWQILDNGQEPRRRARVLQALRDDSLVAHALPVTVQTESLDLGDCIAGLEFNARVARAAGIPLSRAGKMTDVPSHSWVLPTLLRHAGIDFLHLGCNPCNQRPDVPLLYQWEGPDGSRLLTMHNQGYGSDCEFGHGLYPPKDWPYQHWLAVMTSVENAGPPAADVIARMLDETRKNFPGVRVRLGKMEDFADALLAEEKAGASIPVVRADQPDCWIHGMGTMPVEEATARRVRHELTAVELLDSEMRGWGLPRPDLRERLFTARERSLMYGEHTWGGAKNLQGRNAYAMTNFAQFVKTDPTCQWLQRTWDDHAGYIRTAAAITDQLKTQAMFQLATNVNMAGKRLVVFNPLPRARDALVEIPGEAGKKILVKDLPASGYKTIPLPSPTSAPSVTSGTATLENPFLKMTVVRERGGIVSIIEKQTGRELVDPRAPHAFGQYVYARFDKAQLQAYQRACVHIDTVYDSNARACAGWNIRADLPPTPAGTNAVPRYHEMTVQRDAAAQTAVLRADPDGLIASKITTTITLPNDAPWLEIAIQLDNKQPDYWPEHGSLYFPVNAAKPQFRIGRLGAVVDPAKDFARGANRTCGYVNTGAIIGDAGGQGVAICPLDHGIMSFGEKGLGVIDPDYVPATPVAQLSLFNNFWTINFPYWIQGTVRSRVRVWPTQDLTAASLVVPALEALTPVLTAVADGPAGKLPVAAQGLAVSRAGVRLTSFGKNGDADGAILRVWEQSGEAGEVTITLPAGSKFTTARPLNLRGEKAGEPVRIFNGSIVLNLGAYAPASFILE
jgi:alpha-mannosidase